MIRVFVVDDEKLVRRGIIGLIDWEKYGMEVVGDSGNSQETLEFLKREEVDLLFSDLEMPGLSGVPFLQEVKKVRPEIQIVVLTMHQEFELIQQSLRVGILDYITKAQIEGENVDAFMESIRERYRETVRYTQLSERRVGPEEISIWEAPDKKQGKAFAGLLKKAGVGFEKLDDRHLLLQEGVQTDEFLKAPEAEQSSLICLTEVKGIAYSQLEDLLKGTVKEKLFQDREPGRMVYEYRYPELVNTQPGESRKTVLELSMKMEFMLVQKVYEETLEIIRHAALNNEERVAAFYHFNLHWCEFSGKDFSRYFEEVGSFRWWYEWKGWFDEIRKKVLERVGEDREELESIQAIHQAMNYIREHMDREITLEELLRLTGMSKSYFSRNFKDVTGKTFVTYLNDMRIETAKKYLTETKQPIYWIASQVGYVDEHYFRRVFRERTGVTQNSFVKNAKKAENLHRKLVKQDNGIQKRGQSYLQNKQNMILPFLDTNDSGFEAERNL